MSTYEAVRHVSLTDVGVKRSHNQDACAARPAVDAADFAACGHIFIVADGMGGHAVGEKASIKAVRDIPHLFQKHVQQEGVVGALRRAFAETNAAIHDIGQKNPEFRGMGTTSTALIIRPEGAWVGHVGDSRAYRLRDGVIEQLTFDHSYVWEIAKRTGMDPDQLGDFKKNVIIRSLGPDAEVEVDIEGPHPVQAGDVYLLCSDGLTGQVKPEEIGAILNVLPLESAVRLLVHMANLRGGPDNITVVVVEVGNHAAAANGGPPRSGGRLRRRWRSIFRSVPWPYLTILGGSLLGAAALYLHINALGGGGPLFVVAAAVIITGLIGLIYSLGQEEKLPPPETEPRPLNIYRRHDCRITPQLLAQITETEQSLAESLREQNIPVDWAAYQRLLPADAAPQNDEQLRAAFRAHCDALLLLADAYHKACHRQETFMPSWSPPQRS